MEVSSPYSGKVLVYSVRFGLGLPDSWELGIYLHTQLILKRDRKPMKGADGLLVLLIVCIKLLCLRNRGFGEEF